MISKLSLKNIKRSFKDYTIYFFTLILGVAIFYVFNAIDSQTVMLDVTSSMYDIIELMINLLSGVSVFVSFILGFLVIYASRFLIKRRNKEFGIYLTLGMSKRKISSILFLETLFIGIISLMVGLGLGVILSQFMSMLVVNLFEADMREFAFVFSKVACLKTIIYFGIMYLMVMIFNTVMVSKCKLIDLLQASRKSEEVKLKNPYVCVGVFMVAVVVLGLAYYLVTGGIAMLTSFDKIFIPVAMGAGATFFIFWSLSGLILKIVMSVKKFYYKGLNSFILRQFSSKINTTVFSMTIICLMLFVTICVLSSSLSIKNSMTANLDELAPVDLQLVKKLKLDKGREYNETQIENASLSVRETLLNLDFDMNNLKDVVEFNIYGMEDFTFGVTLGDSIEEIQKDYKFLNRGTREEIMKLSDYNKLSRLYNKETYALASNEYIIVADFDSMVEVRNIALKNEEVINVFGVTLRPKYSECQDGFIEISSNHINSGVIIVPDEVVDESEAFESYLVANYKANDKDGKRKIEQEIVNLSESDKALLYAEFNGTTRLMIAEASTGLGALVTFIGIYLGIIFLISSAAILALKHLSDSSDNKSRFKMLRNIGVQDKLINKAIFREIAIFFMTPLVLAIIHAIFGIKFCTFILESFGTKGLWASIMMTMVFLVVIYGGYFLITYFSSKNIIKEK